MNLDPCLTTYLNIMSKWTKYLHSRVKTITILEENIYVSLYDLGLSNSFLEMTPKAQVSKEKIRQTEFHQHRKLLCIKGNYKESEKTTHRASLVAQWLRICLPMQGTRVQALVWGDPTCRGATGPVSHNYWACTSGACAPWQERLRQWEARALRWRVAPARSN